MAISKKSIVTLLLKLVAVLLAGMLLVGVIAVSIVGGEPTYDDTYQSVIQRKYEKLCNTEGQKIIVIGGSNVAFGLDAELMEEKTGRPVINMGLLAGFGNLFNSEIARSHIGPGDVVILAYEYGLTSESFERLGGVNLIMKGIDNNLDIYKEIPLKNMPEILNNIFNYAQQKAQRQKQATGVYSSEAFDEFGNMIFPRESCIIDNYEEELYGAVYGNSMLVSGDDLVYLQELREFVTDRGASVYFSAPVLLENAYQGTEEDMLNYAAEVERRTGIPFISNPYDYVFSSEFMYDTIYHCNEKGERRRTEQLIQDLQNWGIVN